MSIEELETKLKAKCIGKFIEASGESVIKVE